MRSAKTELEKIDFKKITCREAIKEVARIIYKFHDDIKEKDFEVELSWVSEESGRKHQFVPEELRAEAVRIAQELKKKEEMDDSDDDDEKE
jgi:20S proteasome subunit alpha 7